MAGCASQATFGDAITEGEPTPIPTPIVPTKPVYQVQRGDVVYERTFLGRISPVTTNVVGFEIDGRVREVFFAAGDDVQEGDVLAVLDTSDLEAQLLDAEEELAIAQSIFESASNQAQFGHERAQLSLNLAQLYLDHAVSQVSVPPTTDENLLINVRTIERDLAQLSLDEFDNGIDPALLFDVNRARQRVDDINQIISKAELLAPMDGRLTGFTVTAGSFVIAFEAVAVISDLTNLEATNTGSTANIGELAEGMKVLLQPVQGAGNVYDATIVALPQPYGSSVDASIHMRFDNPSDAADFNVGDRLSISVVVDVRSDVLWLPVSAIRQFNGRDFVIVENDNAQQRMDVKLGLQGDGRVEILEGLEEDQTVIGP